MHQAMRGLIRKVLARVAEDGLPGGHHFFVTFDTNHEDVDIADWLRERYPKEMTVVIQSWYENLDVGADAFSITLNFGNSPEPLFIPYDSLITFVDPSVEFGLRFELTEKEEDAAKEGSELSVVKDAPMAEDVKEAEKPAAEIVSLDTFRK